MIRQSNTPALAVLLLLSLFVGLSQLEQIVTGRTVPMVNACDDVSVDYREVYLASLYLRIGWNPYEVTRYVYPPLPAHMNVPVTYLPYDAVKHLVPLAVLFSVLVALLLLHRIFAPPNLRDDVVFALVTLGTLSLSYPFRFLFDRGNLDGFVMLLSALGLYWLTRAGLFGGLMLGLAAALKVYPILLGLTLAARRRWKPLVSMAALLFLLFELDMEHWLRFGQERVFERGAQFRLDENGSLAVTFTYIEWFVARAFGMQVPDVVQAAPSSLARPFYLGSLALMLWCDLRRRSVEPRQVCADVMLYFPFLVAVPQLAYHYQLVWLLGLLPVIGWFWSQSPGRARRVLLMFVTFGIALSQFPAVAVQRALDSILPQFVPGFGLLLVMIGAVALKWTTADPNGSAPVTGAPPGYCTVSPCDENSTA